MKKIVSLSLVLSLCTSLYSSVLAANANESVDPILSEAGAVTVTTNVYTMDKMKDRLIPPNNMLRRMEDLGRGVVAVRNGSNVFISWRLLALDPSGIGFHVYRSTAGGQAVKLNNTLLTQGTNFTDTTANLTKENVYFVKPVIDGKEQQASASFILPANHPDGPYFTVPLRDGGSINHIWVGDLDGDGEYDYLVARDAQKPQIIEAYKRDGTFLWEVDLGPNSFNQDNISPGSATVSVGHWDGLTVYDMDGDGKAEVLLKIANGVTFGDSKVWTRENDTKQWLAVLDGMTGELQSTSELPDDYISVGPLAAHLGIGYLNGTTPSVVVSAKNRRADGGFNLVVAAYHLEGENLVRDWKWLRGSQNLGDGHQIRIADVDGDGKDEIAHIGFVLDHDGTLLYSLTDSNVVHGDRFYIGKMDPNRPGLQGYAIQQDNPYGLLEYYYDATTGSMIWQHTTTPPAWDVGRGDVGDLDPRYPGYEAFSFEGIYNGPSNIQITTKDNKGNPWPTMRMFWDGDLLSESYNNGKIEKWNYQTTSMSRLVTTTNYENAVSSWRGVPKFLGDIMGDWREEAILTNKDYNKLIIFTTPIPTDQRIYTLPQNPLYRNGMTIKGYVQSHLTDYYLGDGMSDPPTPNIYYAGKLIDADVEAQPKTLNVKSNGKFITATIKLASDDISLVNAASIRMNINGETLFAQSTPMETGDHDRDANRNLTVKFDRQQLISALAGLNGSIPFSITGYLRDGRAFTGKGSFNVIH